MQLSFSEFEKWESFPLEKKHRVVRHLGGLESGHFRGTLMGVDWGIDEDADCFSEQEADLLAEDLNSYWVSKGIGYRASVEEIREVD